MKLLTKMATTTGALGLVVTGAVAALSGGSAAATVPAVVHLASTTKAVPSQVTTTAAPQPGPADATGAESATESAADAALPGGGHADAPGANVDHQFDGTE
jgi:hypothetical protein